MGNCSSAALRSLRSLCPLRPLRPLVALVSLRPLRPLVALRPLGALHSLRSLAALLPLVALVSLRPLRPLRPLVALRPLGALHSRRTCRDYAIVLLHCISGRSQGGNEFEGNVVNSGAYHDNLVKTSGIDINVCVENQPFIIGKAYHYRIADIGLNEISSCG